MKGITKGRKVPVDLSKKRMVMVGDFPAKSGFGIVMKNLIERFPYDKYIMGVNYFGDWSEELTRFKVWPANNGGDDIYGYGKLYNFLMAVKPSVLFILNDTWCIAPYKKAVLAYKEQFPLRVVIYTPVDTDYLPSDYVEPLNEFVDHTITYAHFGIDVLKQAGLTTPVSWITHGVDTTIFKPENKILTKNRLTIPPDSYVVLTVAANNPRKRLDLTIQTFAEWVKRYNLPENVRWYYHGSLGGFAHNVMRMVEFYGIKNRLILSDPNLNATYSLSDQQMNLVYNSADLFFSMTQSEGFMLPLAEAMAAKVAALVPNHTALSEWPKGGVEYIQPAVINGIPLYVSTTNMLDTRHITPDPNDAVEKLQMLYTKHKYRRELAEKGYQIVTQNHNWDTIAQNFIHIIEGTDG